jgi:hypothetical protein
MIIDSHVHMGGPDKDGATLTPEELVNSMEDIGVDKAIVFPFNDIDPGISFSKANNAVSSAVEKYPEHLIGFCRLDPNFEEKTLEELERSINELGLKGVKLHPTAQAFTLDHPYVLEVIKKAAEHGVPVVFDNGKKESPNEGIGKLAGEVPDAIIILAHMRGENFIEVCEEHKNLYLGTVKAWNLNKIKEALVRLGPRRIIAGSDSPYSNMRKELIEKFEEIELNKDVKELILWKNIARVLKM